MDDAYVTYHESYVESVWWALSQLHAAGLLYRGHKVVWWWAQGGTVLSAAEVGEGYKTVDDPSLYVQLPLRGRAGDLAARLDDHALDAALERLRGGCAGRRVRGGARRRAAPDRGRGAASRRSPSWRAASCRWSGACAATQLVGRRYQPPFDWFARAAGAA